MNNNCICKRRNNMEIDLTTEQQFELAAAKQRIANVSKEQLEELFIQLYRLYMLTQNVNRQLIKEVTEYQMLHSIRK